MLRKNQRRFRLTSWQVQQLNRISHNLRKLSRDASRELRRIRYTGLTGTQYCKAGDLVGTIATRMISVLRFHDEILKAEQKPERIHLTVHFVEPCPHTLNRSESRQLTGHDDDRAEREGLEPSPAHQAEIERLLELTNSIENLASRRSMLRGLSLDAFFRAINRLRLAVLRQQQVLLATAPQRMPPVEVHFDDGPYICPECLESKEIDGTMEGHERRV